MTERSSAGRPPAGLSQAEKDTPDSHPFSVDPKTAAEHITEGWPVQIIDVRTGKERATTGWIDGSLHIPLAEFGSRASDEIDSAQPVLVYCQSGNRSAFAVEALLASGQEAFDLNGGLAAWMQAGLPVEAN